MEKIHPETGKILHRDVLSNEFCYKGEKIFVDMPGWYPENNDDGIFTRADMAIHDKALTILKAQYEEKTAKNISANVAFA